MTGMLDAYKIDEGCNPRIKVTAELEKHRFQGNESVPKTQKYENAAH